MGFNAMEETEAPSKQGILSFDAAEAPEAPSKQGILSFDVAEAPEAPSKQGILSFDAAEAPDSQSSGQKSGPPSLEGLLDSTVEIPQPNEGVNRGLDFDAMLDGSSDSDSD